MSPKPVSQSLRRACFALGLAAATQAGATTILYPDFSSVAGLQLNGSTASIGNPVGNVLRLTNNLSQSGSAFSTTAIPLNNANSFSTYFSFRISNPMGWSDGDGYGADGIAFVVQTVSNTAGGSGGGIGYQGLSPSVAVEFDTWDNGGWDDYNGNHVGINLNGNIDSVVQTGIAPRMNDGDVWHSWVDYNGATDLLEVRLSLLNLRPVAATLTHTVDLQTLLGSPNAYVGFTSGTGAAGGYHDILSWEFRDDYNPVAAPDAGATGLMVLAALGGVALHARRRRA